MGLGSVLDGYEKSRLYLDSIPDRPARRELLSRPTVSNRGEFKKLLPSEM